MALHPLGALPLPPIVDALLDHIRANPDDWREPWERVHESLRPLPDADALFAALAFGEPFDPFELDYEGHPFEVVPLFWNGGDALQYGMAWYDAAVPPVGVSFAPGDDEAQWMGDTVRDGIAHLLAWATHDAASGTRWADATREQGIALAGALGLDLSARPLTTGARSGRPITPSLPAGWTHVEGPRGIGTAAPNDAFGPEPPDLGFEPERWVAHARNAIAAGHPATALVVLRDAYHGWPDALDVVAAMADAYRALGRDPLAGRVEAYLSRR